MSYKMLAQRNLSYLACTVGVGLMPLFGSAAQAETKMAALAVPPNSVMVLNDTAYVFTDLELNDNSGIAFKAGITSAQITCVKLTLHGKSTIYLTPTQTTPPPISPMIPATPAKAGDSGQAVPGDNPPQNGATGTNGTAGAPGISGIGLNMSVQQLVADDGALWIETDGAPGGPGGEGGTGQKGSSGPQTGFNNPDGGNGGTGGSGGAGGSGGDTSKVTLKIGPNTVTPTQAAAAVAPSTRPTLASGSGVIVVTGAPGAGGPGGSGGGGGAAGEGHTAHFPSTDSHDGQPGAKGATGPAGPTGAFVP